MFQNYLTCYVIGKKVVNIGQIKKRLYDGSSQNRPIKDIFYLFYIEFLFYFLSTNQQELIFDMGNH